MAMIWTGETVLRSLSADVERVAWRPDFNKKLFETWLATMQILQHEGLEELYAQRTPPSRIDRSLRPELRDLVAYLESLK